MLPHSFITSLQGLPGFDQDAFLSVHQKQEQLTSVRLNQFKPFILEAHAYFKELDPMHWCKHGYYLKQRRSEGVV